MFSFDGSVTGASLNVKLPTSADWLKVGMTEAREIRKRTETQGKDTENRPFKPYTKAYAEYRASKGRRTKPNLSFSGRMMGAVGSNVSTTRDSAKITLSGEEGLKAWGNEERGREFLGIPDGRLNKLAEQFGDLIFKRI